MNALDVGATFSDKDIDVIVAFPRIFKRMYNTMESEPYERFCKIIEDYPEDGLESAKENSTFVFFYMADFGVMYEYGYWIQGDKILVGVAIALECENPDINDFEGSIREAALKFPDWKRTEEIIEDSTFAYFRNAKDLREFQKGTDHVLAVQTFLLKVMDELSEMRNEFPKLPWG